MRITHELRGGPREWAWPLHGGSVTTIGLIAVDLAALLAGAWLASWATQIDTVTGIAAVGTLLLLLIGSGAYRTSRGSAEELRLLWLAVVISTLMGALWLEVADRPGEALHVLIFGLVSAVFVPAARRLSSYLTRRLGFVDPPLLLVARAGRLDLLASTVLETPPAGWDLKRDILVQGNGSDLERIGQALASASARCRVVIDLASIDSRTLLALTDELDRSGRPYMLLPSNIGSIPSTFETQGTFAGDLWWLRRQGIAVTSGPGQAVKRAFDLVFSTALVVFTAPLMLLLMVLVKLDGGPILFRSPRIGRGGRQFDCLKLRTMVVGADRVLADLLARDPAMRQVWEREFKLPNDPRITWIGSFLRRSSLDELPQLVNVLLGDMSLVGPRPLLPDERPIYGESLALYTLVRPGLTGLWQVSGRNDLQYQDRIRLNNWYIRNWSLWCDAVILFRTLSVVVRGHGAR